MKKKIEKRNKKRKIDELRMRNVSLQTGMILWIILGIIFIWTVVLPFIFFKFYKKYKLEKKSNQEVIVQLEKEIIHQSYDKCQHSE